MLAPSVFCPLLLIVCPTQHKLPAFLGCVSWPLQESAGEARASGSNALSLCQLVQCVKAPKFLVMEIAVPVAVSRALQQQMVYLLEPLSTSSPERQVAEAWRPGWFHAELSLCIH